MTRRKEKCTDCGTPHNETGLYHLKGKLLCWRCRLKYDEFKVMRIPGQMKREFKYGEGEDEISR